MQLSLPNINGHEVDANNYGRRDKAPSAQMKGDVLVIGNSRFSQTTSLVICVLGILFVKCLTCYLQSEWTLCP